jgi:hypothetical protein
MKKQILIFSAILIIASAGSFYAGTKIKTSDTEQRGQSFNNNMFNDSEQRGDMTPRNNTGNSGTFTGLKNTSGEIITKEDGSLVLKEENGGSKIVILSGETKINKIVEITTNEIKENDVITVMGSENQDGSITAQSIQLTEKTEK